MTADLPPPSGEVAAPVRPDAATWGQRVLAVLVDALVLLVPFSIVESLLRDGFHLRLHVHVPTYDVRGSGDAGVAAFAAVVVWLTYVIATESRRGATFGKSARQLLVVDVRGDPASSRQVWLRNLAKVGFTLTIILGILDDLWPLWDRERQALHDKVAGTFVVRDVVRSGTVAG